MVIEVMEFSKTDFQAQKITENNSGGGKFMKDDLYKCNMKTV